MERTKTPEEIEEERLMRHVLKKTTTRTVTNKIEKTGNFHVHLKAIPVDPQGEKVQLFVEGQKIYESKPEDIDMQNEEVRDVKAHYKYGDKASVSINLKIPIMGVDVKGTFALAKGEYLLYEGTEQGLKTIHQTTEI